ncbi:unnamed protein product, partial [marine sediment metagenome]
FFKRGGDAMRPTDGHQEVLLNSRQLAHQLGVQLQKIYEMTREGMPHYKLGHGSRSEYRFDQSAVKRWLADCRRDSTASTKAEHADCGEVFHERQFIQ